MMIHIMCMCMHVYVMGMLHRAIQQEEKLSNNTTLSLLFIIITNVDRQDTPPAGLNLTEANSPKVSFCACWCATFSVM